MLRIECCLETSASLETRNSDTSGVCLKFFKGIFAGRIWFLPKEMRFQVEQNITFPLCFALKLKIKSTCSVLGGCAAGTGQPPMVDINRATRCSFSDLEH